MTSAPFSVLQKDSDQLQEEIYRKLGSDEDDVFVLLTYLTAELGEVADKVRALEGKRLNSSHIKPEDLATEIVDCVYNLMLIASHYDIKLDDYWSKRLAGIKSKFT